MSQSTLTNADIAERFELLADLLELDGAEVYRLLAYRRAAKVLRETPESVARLSGEGRLTDLPGVGRTIADKVAELLSTGQIAALAKLEDATPPGVVPLMRTPGIGPKTARRIFTDLGISTFEEAVEAAREGRVRELPGMGAKTEDAILAAAAAGPPGKGRSRSASGRLLPFAERIRDELAADPAVERCELAGSLRRFTDTAKDIDLVVSTSKPGDVATRFGEGDWVAAVEGGGDARVTAIAHDGTRVELRMVEPGWFGNLLQHLTGSKDHNVALREAAVRRKLKVSEYGIEDADGEVFASDDEAAVYERLGLPWIPPELRENRGELEAAKQGALPDLVELGQIRGDFHAHTDWSDGKLSLESLVDAARALGRSYLNVTDHSPAVGFGMGLDAGRLRAQIERVRALAETLPDGFTLLAGCEVDILRDGSLDYSDELLAELDVVVASVHASHRLSEADQTKRIQAALENPHVDILGHPTGRMIERREPYAVDIEAVIATAAETGTVLEVSGQPHRLDLRDVNVRLAVQAGVKLAVDTDAHSREALEYLRFGVLNARRGWATADDVVNTREWPEARLLLKDGRSSGG